MHLILNHISPGSLTADDIRSYLIQLSAGDYFQLMDFPNDMYQIADNIYLSHEVQVSLGYMDKRFPLEIALNRIGENGRILSFKFSNPNDTGELLNLSDNTFFKWVLKTAQLAGTMLFAEIVFLSLEAFPNAYTKLNLQGSSFTIEQYPLLMWLLSIQVSDKFIQESELVKFTNEKIGYFLLPATLHHDLFETQEIKETPNENLNSVSNIYISKAEIFEKIPIPSFRRETVRWILHDFKELNQNIINLLKKALQDADWEVRMSAVIASARMGATELIKDIKKVEVPQTGRSGMNREERKILQGIKDASMYILKGGKIDELPAGMPETKEEKRNYLLNCVKGNPVRHFHDALLLVVALADPIYPATVSSLPSAIEIREGKYYLKQSQIELCYLPGITHFVGANEISYHPVQVTKIEGGCFISKYPIYKDKIAWKCTFEEAQAYCQEISQMENALITLPNNTSWEMAARGHNGRVYPWGLSYSENILDLESPWGLKYAVGYGGEWTNSKTTDNYVVIMGASRQMRCSEMNFVEPEGRFLFRVLIQNENNLV